MNSDSISFDFGKYFSGEKWQQIWPQRTIQCLSSCWAFEYDYYGILNWFTAKKDQFDEIYFIQAPSSNLPGATAILSLIQLVALASRYAGWLAHQNQHFQERHLFLAFHDGNSVLQILMYLFHRSYILEHLKTFNWALFFTKPSSEVHLECLATEKW